MSVAEELISEETGAISLAREGRMSRNLDAGMLRSTLSRTLATKPSAAEQSEVV